MAEGIANFIDVAAGCVVSWPGRSRRAHRPGGDGRARPRRPRRRRRRRGAEARTAARTSGAGAARCDLPRSGSAVDRAAARRDAAAARPCRTGGRGAGRVRPVLSRLPPLPDPAAIRAALRTDAGHHRTGHRHPEAGGSDGGPAVEHRPVAAGLGDGGAGAVAPSRHRSTATGSPRGRPGTTTGPHPRSRRPSRPRSRGSSVSTR